MPRLPKSPPLPRIYAWFSAVVSNDLELLSDLLVHGVPIDIPHPLRHSTALMEATRRGHAATVQWLLERGATPAFLCGTPLGTSLHCALRRHHWEIATILADAMHTCAVIDAYGATPLHVLCNESYNARDTHRILILANHFIEKGCPINVLDHEGTTALHHCVINDLHALAEMLLSRGANPNALIPDSQVSPLTIAALEKNLAMGQLLIHYGADPHMRTREGSTPVSIHPPIEQMITHLTPIDHARHTEDHARHPEDMLVH